MTNNKFDKAAFAGRLQQLLIALKEKPTPFAEKIGISRAFMNDVIHLRSGPSIQMIFGITNYREDISINWLLTGKGEMFLNDDEQQRLSAEYWQKNHEVLEAAVKLAFQRLADSDGDERAKDIFKESISIANLE